MNKLALVGSVIVAVVAAIAVGCAVLSYLRDDAAIDAGVMVVSDNSDNFTDNPEPSAEIKNSETLSSKVTNTPMATVTAKPKITENAVLTEEPLEEVAGVETKAPDTSDNNGTSEEKVSYPEDDEIFEQFIPELYGETFEAETPEIPCDYYNGFEIPYDSFVQSVKLSDEGIISAMFVIYLQHVNVQSQVSDTIEVLKQKLSGSIVDKVDTFISQHSDVSQMYESMSDFYNENTGQYIRVMGTLEKAIVISIYKPSIKP